MTLFFQKTDGESKKAKKLRKAED